jgi:cyclophilin family peptidyl-prolyl cis-trans isomerase
MTMAGRRTQRGGRRSTALSWALGPGPLALAAALVVLPAAGQKPAPDPVMVLETAKGTIEIQLFASEAPKSVAQIAALVRRSFYRGQRFHRVTPSLAQVGDPRSRDMTYREHWGSGGSGTPINAFEVSKKRTHQRGTVGLGHAGNPMAADSQFYIMKAASPSLDGKYAIVGQVTSGMAAVDKIVETDVIKNAYLKGEGPK